MEENSQDTQASECYLAFAGVDIAMNTHLKNVKLILKGQSAQPLDSMSVRGNQIRYILLQDLSKYASILFSGTSAFA